MYPMDKASQDMITAHLKGEIKSAEMYGQKQQLRAYNLSKAMEKLIKAVKLQQQSKSNLTCLDEAIKEAEDLLNG